MADDVVIPIVFPDYLIAVPSVKVPGQKVDVPKRLNDWGIPDFSIPSFETPHKVPELGHAGVMYVNGANGLTRYYEYGRYDSAALGLVRKQSISDVKFKGNDIDQATLKITLAQISQKAGQNGRIAAAYIKVPGKFAAMEKYTTGRLAQNSDPKRKPYGLTDNSCCHFMKETVEAAGVDTPWMVDPRPNSYIHELRGDHPDLDFVPSSGTLTIK
jgi:hypothetical protein